MDKRFILAVVLAIGVIWLTPKIFPPSVPAPGAVDTTAMPAPNAAPPAAAAAPTPVAAPTRGAAPVAPVAAETASVATPLATYRFSSAGGALIGASLQDYLVLPGRTRRVELARPGTPLLAYRVIHGGDTLDLSRIAFRADTSARGVVRYAATLPMGAMSLQYTFVADSYLVHVNGVLSPGDATPVRLALAMPHGLASSEADTLDDQRHLAYVWRNPDTDAESSPFTTLAKKGLVAEAGPFEWVASKDKYFLLAVIAPPKEPFTGPAAFTGAPSASKVPSSADGLVLLTPDAQGRFAFQVYAGPQQWRRLVALGHGLENANPYGGFMRALIQPIATLVMSVLLWMRGTLNISYGWVLVIFGVAIRVVLWPLNQSAMRSSIRMQRVQPELQALQAKYKNNPEKMHEEYMKVLAAHGMTPLSQFTGCMPMLIPMPVLFALYFVFGNTIEFRGVPFLWVSDISLRDPLYILPVVMAVTMFVNSWVAMRGSPPNPQAKMMSYMMPGMMLALFWGFPAGLNLYYAVQNIVSLPQQWIIAHERAKNAPPQAVPARK